MPDFATLFTNYVVPFFMFVSMVGYAVYRVRSLGGPGCLVAVFFVVLFGPSLLYALIADESSGALLGASLVAALAAAALMLFWGRKKPGGPVHAVRAVREISLSDADDAPLLRVLSNNTAYLLFNSFPWNNVTEETLTRDIAARAGVRIIREDRDRFIILSADATALDRIARELRGFV